MLIEEMNRIIWTQYVVVDEKGKTFSIARKLTSMQPSKWMMDAIETYPSFHVCLCHW